jgi:hemolysin activation/secretion protein
MASAPLLQSEEFYLGGPLIGRAFEIRELGGDSGVTGLAELRFDGKPGIDRLKSYQLYAFLDAGIVWNRDSIRDQSLSSYGAGLRLFFEDEFSAKLELALPIDHHSPTDYDPGRKVFFSFSKSFKK